ncbi:hypothetical protein F0562_028126 [Nyssa sinensis]|uniref:Uncharacterized protein n=1 Tax=Nyssa sinensis TaxID=561372 RepID=A0A5J5B5K6_9ASTE|nr:hypothetical protein F0562_028126 [Nyssa sinensis]
MHEEEEASGSGCYDDDVDGFNLKLVLEGHQTLVGTFDKVLLTKLFFTRNRIVGKNQEICVSLIIRKKLIAIIPSSHQRPIALTRRGR